MTRATRATVHAIRPDSLTRPPVGAPGVVLGGKFRLEEAIARGGMARVWRATHVTLNRPVAVKFVDAWGATPDERTERFLREAQVAASVRHRHVVDILDFGTTSAGEPYMVMELLEGETLDQRLARGAIPDEECVEIVAQLLSGLDAVHRAGIVHRDLKPGNVFLSDDDVDGVFARLLDFGISQGADDEASEERVVVGTPEYMSPEQAFGEPLDARSDLYSVGVVLYEMLSGVLPFEDPDPQTVVDMVANGTPAPLSSFRPDVPELCAVVERAMAPTADARFATAREMRRALLAAVGRGPDVTGRNSVVPRESRASGTRRAATATVAAEGADRAETTAAESATRSSAPPPRATLSSAPPPSPAPPSAAPPSPAQRPSPVVWIAVGVAVVLVALGVGAAWISSGGREATAGPAPAPAASAAAAPVEAEAPPVADPAPPEPPAAAEAAAVELLPEPSADEDEAAAAEEVVRRTRPARPARRAEPTDDESASQPSIRRELDF